MRKILISALLIGATMASVPASAQSWGQSWGQGRQYRSDDRIDHQIQQIEYRIRTARERRMITRGEADRLLRQADYIDRLEDRYSRNGLTRWEVQDLRQRVQNLRAQLRFERHDGRRWNDRDDRYDHHDRYDRDDRYGRDDRYDRYDRDDRR